jgi:hypothetical protein
MSNSPFFKPLLHALVVSAGIVVSGPAAWSQSAPTGSTQEQIEQAKRDAETMGRQLQYAPTLNADGSVAVNPDGSMKRSRTNSGQIQAGADLMSEITGIQGYEVLADPAGKSGAGGARATVSAGVDFGCRDARGIVKEAAGYSIRFNGCRTTDGELSHVNLQLCSEMLNGNFCDDENYTAAEFYPIDTYSTIDGVRVGIGCTPERNCRITVTGEHSVIGYGDQLAEQGANRGSARDVRQIFTEVRNSEAAEEGRTLGAEFAECYERNDDSFHTSGVVKTCDNQQEVVLSSGGSNASCQPTRVCLKRAPNKTVSVRTTCTRSWDVAFKRCEAKIPTKTCTETTSDFFADSNSCTPDELDGGQVVHSEERTCTRPLSIPMFGVNFCLEWTQVTHYVFPDKREHTGTCSYSAPVLEPQVCTLQPPAEQECGIDGYFHGYCTRPVENYSCLAAPSDAPGLEDSDCAAMQRAGKLNGCTLIDMQQQGETDGLATSRGETYQCSRQQEGDCSEWEVTNNCINIDGDYGVSNMPIKETTDPGSQAEVLASLALVEEIAKEQNVTHGCSDPQSDPECLNNARMPRIFQGKAEKCERPTGWLADALMNDCCKLNLKSIGGDKLGNLCKESEVKLAAARRDKLTVWVGERCSKKVDLGFTKKCVKKEQAYCVYTGILPRIVQEQGRQQLLELSRSSAGATLQTRNLSFPFYQGNGGWTTPIDVNGQQISAYQQPAACRDPANAVAGGVDCLVSVDVAFAVCNKTGTCGALPVNPEEPSTEWQLASVDPLDTTQTALSRFALARGSCDPATEQCVYEISAWPAGVGGRAILTRQFMFQYASREPSRQVMLGDLLIKALPVSGGVQLGTLPADIPITFSTDSGKTWKFDQLPSRIEDKIVLPATDVTITGGCSKLTGLCDYQVAASLRVEAMPTGSVQAPNCDGFTIAQFSALDLSKMDLSEWEATIHKDGSLPEGGAVADRARNQAQQGNTNTSIGTQKALSIGVETSRPGALLRVKLYVAPNSTLVGAPSAVDVDWGDCSLPVRAAARGGGGFETDHEYAKPYWTPGHLAPQICDVQGKLPAPGTGRSMTHRVTITAHFDSGKQIVETVDIENQLQ